MRLFSRGSTLSERFISRKIGDEEVWVDLAEGQFFTINPTGVRVVELWREGLREPAEIARHLAQDFEVGEAQAVREVEAFLAEARDRGFLPT